MSMFNYSLWAYAEYFRRSTRVTGDQRAHFVVGYNIYVCPKATITLKGQKRDQIKSDNAYGIPMNRKQMQKRVSISVHPTLICTYYINLYMRINDELSIYTIQKKMKKKIYREKCPKFSERNKNRKNRSNSTRNHCLYANI